ncbi:MAG: magnesium-translocating P-type ATPase [Acidimicrobiales bacterium]
MTVVETAHAPPPLDILTAAALPPNEVLARLGTSDSGLSAAEAAQRLREIGPNALKVHKVRALTVLVRQLRNPLLLLLLAAAAVSGFTGDPTDAAIITVIVALSVGLSFLNEYRADLAVEALHESIRHEADVCRDGQDKSVNVTDLVPGDVVSLWIGAVVPADIRLLQVDQLECDEAVLTGESMPATKAVEPTPARSEFDLPGCAFMGTIVHEGSGRGVVVRTGITTEFGKIAAGLSERQTATAFQAGLSQFSKFLFGVALLLTAGIFIINVSLGRHWVEALLFSLAIAVGITPEMMPAIVTVSLSSGARALADKKVLVKRLVAIEDIGNIEILFTDKTGTITEGTVAFQRALDPDGATDTQLFTLGLVCNEATLSNGVPVSGNGLDQALWLANDDKVALTDPRGPSAYRRLGILPFDHDRQMGTVLVLDPNGQPLLITKGAPEAVLSRCTSVSKPARTTLDGLFAEGARVVAVATRATSTTATPPTIADEQGLTLRGYLVFADPPKRDAGDSIAKLGRLGIDVKIITGDNGVVAAKVCHDIGLENLGVLTGKDLEALNDEQLTSAIPTTTIFARTNPDQKSRIIKVARRTGKDVAFLGDGVNDAVALHNADVGISVESATDVAKDAADIVLLEKDLGVLADGVNEGRRIFANTMKYVLMATSSNFGNMFSAAGASIFLTFLPMLPSQILLNNLLYDTGQLVIPTDNVDPEALARPAAWDIGFIRRFMSVFGPLSSIFDFLTFWVMLSLLHAGHSEFRSGWFVESIATQTLVIYVIRTRRVPFFRSRPSVPMLVVPTTAALVGAVLPFTPLAKLLGFKSLPITFFLALLGMIVAYLLLVEIAKSRFYRQPRPPRRRSTEAERSDRHTRRRAARFVRHTSAGTSTAVAHHDTSSAGGSDDD